MNPMRVHIDGKELEGHSERAAVERGLAALKAGVCEDVELEGRDESLILSAREGAFHCELADDHGRSEHVLGVPWTALAQAAWEFLAGHPGSPGGALERLRTPLEGDDGCIACRALRGVRHN
jgi:hypothetical protein